MGWGDKGALFETLNNLRYWNIFVVWYLDFGISSILIILPLLETHFLFTYQLEFQDKAIPAQILDILEGIQLFPLWLAYPKFLNSNNLRGNLFT